MQNSALKLAKAGNHIKLVELLEQWNFLVVIFVVYLLSISYVYYYS